MIPDNRQTAVPKLVQNAVMRKLLPVSRTLGKFFVQFLFPLIMLGPLLMVAERAAEFFGFQGDNTQFMRLVMLGLYFMIFLVVIHSTRNRPDR